MYDVKQEQYTTIIREMFRHEKEGFHPGGAMIPALICAFESDAKTMRTWRLPS